MERAAARAAEKAARRKYRKKFLAHQEAVVTAPIIQSRSLKSLGKAILGAGGTGIFLTFAIGSFGPAGVLNMTTVYVMLAIAWLTGTYSCCLRMALGVPAQA